MGRDVRTFQAPPDVSKLILKGVVGAISKRGATVTELPQRSFLMLDQKQDLTVLAGYDRVCGFTLRNNVPATWLHVQTFPLQAALMAEDDFPFSLPGLVHVSNRMTLHRPVSVDETLRIRVWTENLQPHAKGAAFDMRGEIHAGDDLVWEGSSNYLATGARMAGEPVKAERLPMPGAEPSQFWRLPANLGRRYAAVSSDSNPIHLSPVMARLFGFPRPIIHGMWTHARALAAFGGRLPSAYRVSVQFAKPILLPGKVGFASERRGDGQVFAVVNRDGKPHLVGELVAGA